MQLLRLNRCIPAKKCYRSLCSFKSWLFVETKMKPTSDNLKLLLVKSDSTTGCFLMDGDKFDICYGGALFPAV